MTDNEKKLAAFLNTKILPKEYEFNVMVCLVCRKYNLTDDLVDYIENNDVTEQSKIYDWLFDSENGHIEYVENDEEDE